VSGGFLSPTPWPRLRQHASAADGSALAGHADRRVAGADKAEFLGGGLGQVEHAALDERTAVVDAHHDGLAVVLVGHRDFGAEGQLTVAVFVLPAKPRTYADIALAGYEDALTTAQALDAAVDALIANPSQETLARRARPGRPRASPTSRRKPTASAMPSSTIGKAA
jgi:hypothetical protein